MASIHMLKPYTIEFAVRRFLAGDGDKEEAEALVDFMAKEFPHNAAVEAEHCEKYPRLRMRKVVGIDHEWLFGFVVHSEESPDDILRLVNKKLWEEGFHVVGLPVRMTASPEKKTPLRVPFVSGMKIGRLAGRKTMNNDEFMSGIDKVDPRLRRLEERVAKLESSTCAEAPSVSPDDPRLEWKLIEQPTRSVAGGTLVVGTVPQEDIALAKFVPNDPTREQKCAIEDAQIAILNALRTGIEAVSPFREPEEHRESEAGEETGKTHLSTRARDQEV